MDKKQRLLRNLRNRESQQAFRIVRKDLLAEYARREISPAGFATQRLCRVIDKRDGEDWYSPSIRNYFIFKISQYLQPYFSFSNICQHELVRKIAVLGELTITLMYLDNHAQDLKYGIRAEDQVSLEKNRAEYLQVRMLLTHWIDHEFDLWHGVMIHHMIGELFTYYNMGMLLDEETLTYACFDQNNPDNRHEINGDVLAFVDLEEEMALLRSSKKKYGQPTRTSYIELLLTRCHLMNALFFQLFAELCGKIFEAPDGVRVRIRKWSKRYGLMQQLVNDNIDYLPKDMAYPTNSKYKEDTFNDARRKLVTLPIITAAHKDDVATRRLIRYYQERGSGDKFWNPVEQKEALANLISAGALNHAIHLTANFSKGGKGILNPANPSTETMEDMFSMALHNQYYQSYWEASKKNGIIRK
ncbi:MAG: hypothetical protein AAFR61_11075 [Bacteroidota bacterium]